jgi:hypothetical protein
MADSLIPFTADDLIASSAQPAAGGDSSVSSFVAQYLPVAQRVSQQTGVAPQVLLGQWGLETGWGKSVVPGTHNLGNIKDFSGAGTSATDNQTGSVDRYRTYGDPDAFGDDYSRLIGSRYRGAMGAGGDAGRFFSALQQGGYAQDKDYVSKGVAASAAAAQAMGGAAQPSQGSYYDAPSTDRYVPGAGKTNPTISDYAKEFAASALEGVGSIGQGVGEMGATLMNDVTGTEDYEGKNLLTSAGQSVRDTMSPAGKEAVQDAAIEGNAASLLTGDWNSVKLPTSAAGWGMLAAGGFGSLAPALIPMVGTAGRVASLARAAEAAQAAGDLAKAAELARAAQAASTTAKVVTAGNDALMMGGGGAEAARANVQKQVDGMTHDQLMQQVPVYAEVYGRTGDEREARNAVVNSAARWAGGLAAMAAAAGGAFNSKVLEDFLVGKGTAAMVGQSTASRAGRAGITAAGGAVGGAGQMGAMKAGQNAGENIAMGQPADQDLTRNMAGDLVSGGLLGGVAGAVGGATTSHDAAEAPAPAAPEAPAPAPNSPLGNAANAGIAAKAAAEAAMPPAPAPQADPISAKVDDIKQRMQQGGLLDALRSGDSPVDTKQFLRDLAVAGSPSTAAHLREQAMSRLEFALGWADQNAPQAASAARVDAAQRQAAVDREAELLQQLQQAQTPAAREQIQREIDANRQANLGAPVPRAPASPEAPPIDFDADGLTSSPGAAPESPQVPGIDAEPGELDQRFNTDGMALADAPAPSDGAALPFDGSHIPTDNLELAPTDDAAPAPAPLPFDGGEPSTSLGAAPERPAHDNAIEPPADQFDPRFNTDSLSLAPQPSAAEQRAEAHQQQVDAANAAGDEARAQRLQQQRDAEVQRQEQAAAAADARASARPNVDQVVAALRPEPFQRTAEQKAAIARARATYAPGDMALIEAAARAPFSVDAVGRARLNELRQTAARGDEGRSAPAALRKRRDHLQQLAALGFDTVERHPDGFRLRNSRTGQELKLDGMADAQLARQAIRAHIDEQAHQASTSPSNELKEPTDAQKQAGNYKKGRIANLNGLRISIENPQGSMRRGVSPEGKAWETKLAHHYGDIEGTKGADGDPVDVFIGPRPDSKKIFVVDQKKPDGSFDEHKVMMGFTSKEAARRGYLENYEPGWDGLMAITEMSPDEFKSWVNSDAAQRPAYESAPGRVTVRDEGREITVPLVHDDDLPTKRSKSGEVTQGQAALLRKVASVFGKRVQFFDDPGREILSDGFVRSEDPSTIYLNRKTTVSALSVFGHELMHLLRQERPEAYDAVAAAVQARVKDEHGFLRYYGDTSLSHDAMLEELVSDLNGDLMRDGKFWREVFDEITQAHGDDAKGIIASLAEVLERLFKQLVDAFKGERGFESQRFLENAHELRDTFRKALAEYGRDQGISKAAMQAEILRLKQKSKEAAKSPQREDAAETPAFERWFGDSKVVDEDGAPLKVYHGSPVHDFKSFDLSKVNPSDPDGPYNGFWFSTSDEEADRAGSFPWGRPDTKGQVRSFYLSLKNPATRQQANRIASRIENDWDLKYPEARSWQDATRIELQRQGFDGIVHSPPAIVTPKLLAKINAEPGKRIELGDSKFSVALGDNGKYEIFYDGHLNRDYDMPKGNVGEVAPGTYVAFRPEQIKSASDNDGSFDPNSADITRSRRREDFDNPADRVEVSTTVPTAKKGGKLVNDAVGQKWIIDQADIEQAKEHAAAAEAAIRSYNAVSVDRKASAFDALRHVVVDNLVWLYDKMPPAVRERAKLWYDGANRIASGWAREFHLDERQVAGVLAVLSPQKDWFMNVSLAERLIRIYEEHRNEPWSPAMTQWVRSYVDASKTVQEKAARAGLLSDAIRLQGKTLAEMSDRDAARFIRVFDETYFPRSYRVVTPEGGFGDFVTKGADEADVDADEVAPGNVAWGSYPTIEKGVAILRSKPDQVFQTVSDNLGGEHKVRNFYNNIIRPNSADGHVTIDTHAVAAAFIKALSGTSTEVMHNFGTTPKGEPGAGGNASSGASGLYGAFADAYREAAAKVGVLPREMQSITWEAIRSIFQPSFKSKRAGDVEGLFNRYKAGEISREQARDQAYDMAGGIKAMPWEGTPEGRFVEEGGASFDAGLHDDPEQRAARELEPQDAKDKVQVSLSAATHSIPGLAELHRLASRGDSLAHELLHQVALDNVKHLLAGTSAHIKEARATGLYGGESEASLALNITFSDADRDRVLAGLAKFAENFKQEQVHVRQATKDKQGTKFGDGSYVTPVYRWHLDQALSRKQIQRVIDQSGLYGLTFGDDFVEAYFVGDVANEQQYQEFYRAAGVADRLLAKAGGRLSAGRARLWPYGHGDGAIGYERIRGDVASGPAIGSATARRVAEYLNAEDGKAGKVKTFPQAKEITEEQAAKQREIAQAYEALPDNDLGNPRVRRAYRELAKEVVRQYKALPVKVEVLTGQGEPYKNSAEMRRDVLDNNHLYIYGTTPSTFGPEGVDFSGHPLLEPSGLKDVNGHPLLMNDLLRAVHDYYAHTMSPVEFGPKGEEAAWLNHMSMTSNPWARWALTSETRGQNSWVNFRHDLEPSTPIKDRPFARQKAALLPVEHSLTGDRTVDKPMKELIDQLPEQQRLGSLKAAKDDKLSRRRDADPRMLSWKQAQRRLEDAGYSVERDDRDAPIVKKDGVEAHYASMPKDLREAWNALSVDDPGEPDAHDFGAERALQQIVSQAVAMKFSRTRTPEFKAWFGDSKVRDDDGTPRIMYTGTSKDVDFKEFRVPKNGVWFTADPKVASEYAKDNDSQGSPYNPETRRYEPVNTAARVIPAYLKIDRPYKLTDQEAERLRLASNYKREQGIIFNQARAKGYDGVDIGGGTWVVLKDPAQIKSAIGNGGGFDPGKKDITKSRQRGDFQWEGVERADGGPEYFAKNFALVDPIKLAADDFAADHEPALPLGHAAHMDEGNEAYQWRIVGRDGQTLGMLAGQVTPEGEISAVHDLAIDQQRNGVGRDVMAHIAANRTGDVKVVEALPQSQGFWDKMGAGYYDVNRNTTLDWNTLSRGLAGEDAQAPREAAGGSAERIPTGEVEELGPDEAEGLKFSKGRLDEEPDGSAKQGWDTPSASKFDDMVYTLQDKHVDTKRVVDAIKQTAGEIRDDLDVYLQEELFHGRAAKRTEDFVHGELRPLVEEMKSSGLSIAELDQYLHARHAREANEVIAQRNPDLKDAGSGMSNQDAAAYFAELSADKRAKLDAAAKHVDAMLRKTNELLVDYELESAETVQGWGEMFQHYVPLMREDDGRHTGNGTGQGFSIKGREVKSRTGSTRKVVDILANIAMQRERTIVRGEKNRIARALVGLADANPNKDFWHVDVVPKNQVFNKDTGKVEERPDPLFKQRDNVLVAKIAHPGGIHEHAVIFNEKNERAVRMAAALKNLDASRLEGLLGVSAKVTRYFAAVNTQYNPVFGVVNLIRDVQESLVNLQATELAGQQKKVARYTLGAIRGIYSDLRAVRKGDHTEQGEWGKLWEEFQEAGGQTGYRQMFASSADRAKAIEKALNPEAWMNSKLGKIFTANGALKVPMAVAQRGAKWLFDWLADYNESMENGVRLAAYKAGLEAGMSKERAASLAKNLTVNFNRKGQIAQQAGALYAFFNASMQGTARMATTLFTMEPGKPKTIRLSSLGKKIVFGGMLLGTVQALAMAAAGFNDDDPPEFMRENGLIIPLGGKKYASIPLPGGLRIIPSIGRVTTQWALSGFKRTPQRIDDLISLFADSFNPIGNAGMSMQTLAPTAFDPLVALTENKDFTGRPIAKESHNKATPGPELVRDTASSIGKLLSEGINYLSGGTQYTAGVVSPTPDQIDYLLGQVTGGVGRELNKLEQSALGTARGEDVPLYKVPLVGRFIGDASGQASEGNEFYANSDRLNELDTEMKGMRADGKALEANQVRMSHPESYMITMANHAERAIQKLKQQKSQLIKDGAPREAVAAIEQKITGRMAALNRAMERLTPQ